MKLIISKATVTTLDKQSKELCALLNAEDSSNFFEVATRADAPKFANHSVTLVDGEYILEINDEGMFKYMALYLKVARIIHPFIKPVMALISTIGDDLDDITRFFTQQK